MDKGASCFIVAAIDFSNPIYEEDVP